MSNMIHVSIALAFAMTSACGLARGEGPEEGVARDAAAVTSSTAQGVAAAADPASTDGVVVGAATAAPRRLQTVRAAPPRQPGAASRQAMRPRTTVATLQYSGLFWALQMNLCNSGKASCYSMNRGQSVPEAVGIIGDWVPDLVTVNEICEPDLDALWTALQNDYPGDWTFAAFFPAVDGSSANPGPDQPIRCGGSQTNPADVNQPFGSGIIGHVRDADWIGVDAVAGIYANQPALSSSNEWRTWMCVYAIGNYYGCVTHLTNVSGSVAMAQCHEFMDEAIPFTQDFEEVYFPTAAAGDLNLKFGGSPNVQDCVPSNYYRKGDGGVQHVMLTREFSYNATEVIDMQHTDHDALMVMTTLP